MSYAINGSGTHAVSAGVEQLYLAITTTPANAGEGRANPVSKYDVGLIRAGDGTGWWPAIPIVGGPQWIGLPHGTTEIAYVVFNTGVVEVTEVALPNPFTGPEGPVGPAGPAGGSGGLALISKQTLLANAASVTFAAIPATYTDLQLLFIARGTNAAAQGVHVQFNGDTGANYDDTSVYGGNTSAPAESHNVAATGMNVGAVPGSGALAGAAAAYSLFIPSYAQATFHKQVTGTGGRKDSNAQFWTEVHTGYWRDAAAISQIVLAPTAGNFLAGSQFALYGMG